MALKVTKIAVWAAKIKDRPGALGAMMKALAGAGANLECVIARRQPDKPGTGVVFLTPLKGRRTLAAARTCGFRAAHQVATLKIEGADRRGVGAKIARAVGAAGVSMRGLSAAVVSGKFVGYIAFDSRVDAAKAAKALKALR
jgi:predicted amino acid-binding ACT domain protein